MRWEERQGEVGGEGVKRKGSEMGGGRWEGKVEGGGGREGSEMGGMGWEEVRWEGVTHAEDITNSMYLFV